MIFLIIFTTNIYLTRSDEEISNNLKITLIILDSILILYMMHYWNEELY